MYCALPWQLTGGSDNLECELCINVVYDRSNLPFGRVYSVLM